MGVTAHKASAADKSRNRKGAAIRQAEAAVAGQVTELRLRLSRRVIPKVSTLSRPYRAIMDFPDTAFELPPSVGRTGAGMISAFRYGLITPRVARMVVDATGPFRVQSLRVIAESDGSTGLVLEMVPVPRAKFVAQGRSTERPVAEEMRKAKYDHRAKDPRRRPVVVIDPGHGGPDPGAIGKSDTYEKTIVLQVARRLRNKLAAKRRYRVIMTRTRDIYVSLADRVKLSEKVGADLFLSLHADATAQPARTTRGASIYTLSSRASDRLARLFAQKENASDILAGFELPADDTGSGVESILIDLLKRETRVFSTRVRDEIIRSLKGKIRLNRDTRRAAAFKVLKQTATPSVLIELGYISNPQDESEMRSRAWQSKAADAISRAVDAFFRTRRSVMR